MFNESMSSDEARNLMYASAKGKTREEVEAIKREYKEVAPKIYKREMSQERTTNTFAKERRGVLRWTGRRLSKG